MKSSALKAGLFVCTMLFVGSANAVPVTTWTLDVDMRFDTTTIAWEGSGSGTASPLSLRWGIPDTVKQTGGQAVAHKKSHFDTPLRVDDGDTLELGSLTLTVIHTPGHTDDSICILGGDKLVTGDTLFVGKVGGTDFGEAARKEYNSLHKKLMTLDDNIEVCPGHDYGVAPTSTIGHERKTNPFILRDSFESFVELKRNWLQYKTDHGID